MDAEKGEEPDRTEAGGDGLRMQELEHQKQREDDKGERAEKRRIQMEEEEDKDREERTKLMELPVNTLKNK